MSPRPEVGDVAADLYESLGALTTGDEANDWALLNYCAALTSGVAEQINEIVADRDDYPGWTILFDPDACPAWALPYLAQFVGVTLLPADSEERQREKIQLPEQFKRGTPAALEAAVRATLTGGQTILTDERFGGSAWALRVRTLDSETPDATVTEAAVVSQKPIGITLEYEAVTGQDWSDVDSDWADWAAMEAAFPDWAAVKTAPP